MRRCKTAIVCCYPGMAYRPLMYLAHYSRLPPLSLSLSPQDLWYCTKNNAQGCSLQLNDVPEVAWFPYVPTYQGYFDYASGWGAPSSDAYYTYAVNNTGGSLVRPGAVWLDPSTGLGWGWDAGGEGSKGRKVEGERRLRNVCP